MLTREEYIRLKKNNEYNIEDMWEFYQNAEHDQPKIDYLTFQQTIPHYIHNNSSMSAYHRFYDHQYQIMYLKHNKISLVI